MAKKKAARKAAKKSAKKSAKKAAKKASKKVVKKTAKKAARMPMKKKRRKVSSKRELINTGTDKRYVRRSQDGTFKESDDVSRSLSADARQQAATDAAPGQGDTGD
jgi:hypothetical protein